MLIVRRLILSLYIITHLDVKTLAYVILISIYLHRKLVIQIKNKTTMQKEFRPLDKNQKPAMVSALAGSLRRLQKTSSSESMSKAWESVKANSDKLGFVKFQKISKSGKVTTHSRVILEDRFGESSHQTSGVAPDGRILFTDFGRVLAGEKNPIISTYADRIVKRF